MSSFPIIKNIEQWDNWLETSLQGLKYMPSNPAEVQVFDAQQNYITLFC